MSADPSDIDAMLLREFRRASFANHEADQKRWRVRAVDKVFEEMTLLGYAGFRVREVGGRIVVEGICADGVVDVPAHLREGGAL